MPALTTNFNLNLPTVGGDTDAWGGQLNSNWSDIDTWLAELWSQNAAATRSSRVQQWGIWFDTDDETYYVFDGTNDDPIFGENPISSGFRFYFSSDDFIERDAAGIRSHYGGSLVSSMDNDRLLFEVNSSSLYRIDFGSFNTSITGFEDDGMSISNRLRFITGLADFDLEATGRFTVDVGTSERFHVEETFSAFQEDIVITNETDLSAATRNIGGDFANVIVRGGQIAVGMYRSTTGVSTAICTAYSDVGGSETRVFQVNADGDVANATGNYGTISDKRLKKNIRDAEPLTDEFLNIEWKRFDKRKGRKEAGEYSKDELGFIAQDVQYIFPELVSVHNLETATYDGVGNEVLVGNYSKLIPIMGSVLKELIIKLQKSGILD